jgi:Tol biopolymer transport system component
MKTISPFLKICLLSFAVTLLSCKENNTVTPSEMSCESQSIQDQPQGKLVFFLHDTTIGSPGLYTMKLDGNALTPVAVEGDSIFLPGLWGDYYFFQSFLPQNPQWSPDGTKIMCELRVAADARNLIMLMNANGTDKKMLLACQADASNPDWSPSGNLILFSVPGQGENGLKIINISENSCQELNKPGTRNPYIFQKDSLWFVSDIHWGPSENILYVTASVNKRPPDGAYIVGGHPENEIFAININTGEIIERITSNNIDEEGFRLSPDGQQVAFKRGDYGQSNTFYVICLANGAVTSFPNVPPFSDFVWNWSNDSQRIVFSANGIIYMFDIHRLGFQQLTSFGAASQPDLFIVE